MLRLLLTLVAAIACWLAPGIASASQAAAAGGAPAGMSFQIEPAPAWVTPLAGTPATSYAEPMYFRLYDQQTLLERGSRWEYTHSVRVANSTAGLAPASQIELDFDPSFEELVLHRLEVIRAGQAINKLDRSRIRLLQRETQLERQIYDGRVTASLVLDDVRVGDLIDLEFSKRGANPVFKGRFAEVVWMRSSKGPIANQRYRLIAPRSRQLKYKAGSSLISASARDLDHERRELLFERRNAPQFIAEPGATWSALMPELLHISEYADWRDVSLWGAGLFAEEGKSAQVDAKAAEIRGQARSPEERLLRALEFVQKDVRYFGTEIGPYTHQPAQPERVLQQRFGDCKDKALLLSALLRRLDIPSTPVLVSTMYRKDVASILPSPLAFDHVITRVDLDGKAYWLDATREHQSGTVTNRQIRGLGNGLPLADGVPGLVEIPPASGQRNVAVLDRFVVSSFAQDPVLESRVTYRGEFAESVRAAIAQNGLAQIQTQINDSYVRLYPGIKSLAPTKIEEVPEDNAFAIVQRFGVPDFWTYPEQKNLEAPVAYWSLGDMLRIPNQQSREHPFSLSAGLYEHRIRLEYPDTITSSPSSERKDETSEYFLFRSSFNVTSNAVELTGALKILGDAVPPAGWSAHSSKVVSVAKLLDNTAIVSAIPFSKMDIAMSDLAALAEAIEAKKIEARTEVQRQALTKSLLLTKHLEGNRLAPKLKAQALSARAIASDHLGHLDAARADFDAALQLAPDAPDALAAAAVNAMLRRDTARAVQLTDRLLAIRPNDIDGRFTRARVRFFSGDYRSALADLEALLQEPEAVRRGYPLLFLFLAAEHGGGEGKSKLRRYTADLGTEWPRPLVDLLLGETTEDAVLRNANEASRARELLCEAYFYIGARYLADGNQDRAKEHFRKAVDQGIVEYFEDRAARNELARLARRQ